MRLEWLKPLDDENCEPIYSPRLTREPLEGVPALPWQTIVLASAVSLALWAVIIWTVLTVT